MPGGPCHRGTCGVHFSVNATHYSAPRLSNTLPCLLHSYQLPLTTSVRPYLRVIHRQCSKALSLLLLIFTAPISIPFLPSLLSAPSLSPFLLPLSLSVVDVAAACHSEFMQTPISASTPSPRLVFFFSTCCSVLDFVLLALLIFLLVLFIFCRD